MADGDGTWIGPLSRRWPDPGTGPWLVTIHWQVLDGRPEPVALDVASSLPADEQQHRLGEPDALPHRGLPLRTALLRQLRLAEVIAEERVRVARLLRERDPAAPTTKAPRPQGMRDATARRLQQAAEVYRDAWTQGRPDPNRAVAEHFGVSVQAAAKLTQRARSAGLLPPTAPGTPSG